MLDLTLCFFFAEVVDGVDEFYRSFFSFFYHLVDDADDLRFSLCGGYGFLRLVRDALDLQLFRVDDVHDHLFLLRLLGALLVVAGVLVLRLHDIPNRSRGWS